MTEAYRQSFPAKNKVSSDETFSRLNYWFKGEKDDMMRKLVQEESEGVFEGIYRGRADVCNDLLLVDMLNLMRIVEQSELGEAGVREKLAVYLEGRIDQFTSMGKPAAVSQSA